MSEIPKNTKNTTSPYKKDLYETYITWKSIPSFLKQLKAPKVVKILGVDEETLIELVSIKNQSAFAEKYGVENSTLTNWNKLIEKRKILDDMRKWATNLTKNVAMSLYRQALSAENPLAVKLWFQVIEGWSDKKSPVFEDREYATAKIHFVTKTKQKVI